MRTRLLWGILLFAMTGVIIISSAAAPRPSPLLPKAVAQVPLFKLIDETDRPFESTALKGRVWIADFIFTSCAGTCPQMTEKMRLLQNSLPGEIQLVSISVDPLRDRPSILADYAKKTGAQAGRWHFLTGSPAEIGPLVQKGFRLSYAEGGSPEEPVTHSVRFVLVDREGGIRGYYDSTDPKAIQQLLKEATQLVH